MRSQEVRSLGEGEALCFLIPYSITTHSLLSSGLKHPLSSGRSMEGGKQVSAKKQHEHRGNRCEDKNDDETHVGGYSQKG